MSGTIQKIISIADTIVDLVLDKLLEHTRLQTLIDKRIDTKLALLDLPRPNVEGPGFLRLHEIVNHPKNPKPLIPISRSGFWAKVKEGEYPQPVKLGPKTTAWKRDDIMNLVKQLEARKKK